MKSTQTKFDYQTVQRYLINVGVPSINLFVLDLYAPEQSPDLALIQQRMKEVAYVLADFKTRKEEGR